MLRSHGPRLKGAWRMPEGTISRRTRRIIRHYPSTFHPSIHIHRIHRRPSSKRVLLRHVGVSDVRVCPQLTRGRLTKQLEYYYCCFGSQRQAWHRKIRHLHCTHSKFRAVSWNAFRWVADHVLYSENGISHQAAILRKKTTRIISAQDGPSAGGLDCLHTFQERYFVVLTYLLSWEHAGSRRYSSVTERLINSPLTYGRRTVVHSS